MKYMSKAIMTALVALPLIYACGKGDSGDGKSQKQEVPEEEGTIEGSTIDGLYMAKFETLNPHVNGTLPGSLTFYRNGDRVMTYVRLFAGKPKAWHPQGIYMGKRCPNLGDDKNRDGFIDIEEAMAVVGKVIIPLDSNMNSQSAGRNFYPLGDLSGYYHYERVSSFNRMMEDLRSEDNDPADHITKLAPNQKFTIEGKVIIVQGVSEDTILPESVVGLDRRKNFQTLPITCGVIKKVTKTPGVPDNEVIPGPVAEVDPNQDRPANPEDLPGGSGGTVAGTTGTNDTNDGEVGDEGGTEGGTTAGGTQSGGSTGRGTPGRTSGGFIGGFIGGSSGGRTSGSTSGSTVGGTQGRSSGGFIGGFIGGSSGGRTSGSTSGSTSGEEDGSTTGESSEDGEDR